MTNSPSRPSLEAQLQNWAAFVEEEIPPFRPPLHFDRRHPVGRRRHVALVGAALAAVTLVVVILARSQGSDTVVTGGGAGSVQYERIEVRIDARGVSCPGGHPASRGGFDQFVLEAWGDRTKGVWKNVVTYPDGTTGNFVAVGSPWYPTQMYSSGEARGDTVWCADASIGVMVSEPDQLSFVSLNPMADIPSGPDASSRAIPGYRELATMQPGPHADDRGRPAQLWRQVVTGTVGSNPTNGRPVTQTTDWYVEPSTGVVLEKTYTDTLDGVGTARLTLILTAHSDTNVTTDFFSTQGLQPQGSVPQPRTPATDASGLTTTASRP